MNVRHAPRLHRIAAALAAATVALAVTACATPPAGSDRAVANREKQDELQQMERRGQRNDDRPLPK